MKECKDCHEFKGQDDFYANKYNNDGLGSYCKSCSKKRALINKKKYKLTIEGRMKMREWDKNRLKSKDAMDKINERRMNYKKIIS